MCVSHALASTPVWFAGADASRIASWCGVNQEHAPCKQVAYHHKHCQRCMHAIWPLPVQQFTLRVRAPQSLHGAAMPRHALNRHSLTHLHTRIPHTVDIHKRTLVVLAQHIADGMAAQWHNRRQIYTRAQGGHTHAQPRNHTGSDGFDNVSCSHSMHAAGSMGCSSCRPMPL